jgi:hypothetical protein
VSEGLETQENEKKKKKSNLDDVIAFENPDIPTLSESI